MCGILKVFMFLLREGRTMFKSVTYAGIIAFILFCSGCSVLQNRKHSQTFPDSKFDTLDQTSAELLKKRAEVFTQAMVRSFNTGDFSHWRDSLKQESAPGKPPVVSEAKFRAMRERLEKHWGKLVKCHYLGSLDQSIFRDYIWKCTFESKTPTGEFVRLEELFVVRCTLLNGKTTFAGFGFRFFNNAGFRDQVIKIKKAEVKK